MSNPEILEIFEKLFANIRMLNAHEYDYKDKFKGPSYTQNKLLIQKRIIAFREKIQHIGKKVNVVKVTYMKDLNPHDMRSKLLAKAKVLPKHYYMILSDIDKEIAKKWVKYLIPEAINIQAQSISLAVEFSE